MKKTFINLLNYLKNPVLEKDQNSDIKYRLKIFLHILSFSIVTGIVISPVFYLFEELNWISLENHKVEELFDGMSKLQIILLGAIAVPIIEELLFRGPITSFKKPKAFKLGFYFFTLAFGLVHLTNFDITTNVLILAPILVLPQTLVGAYFGFIRVRFGLQWSMLLHGSYNLFFILLGFLSDF
ncbi:CPBP family intramembrane glutamic endopeptidase [Polaribacter sp.]|uniref:CPBP family intramembrane glutamic endopeptidase n=1 Tax=Polaribacter sp. TaxID=1920175 RepID=UPI003F6BE1D6